MSGKWICRDNDCTFKTNDFKKALEHKTLGGEHLMLTTTGNTINGAPEYVSTYNYCEKHEVKKAIGGALKSMDYCEICEPNKLAEW